MADTILTNSILSKYVSAYFRNSLKAIKCAYMPFDTDYQKDINGYNIGATLQFRLATYTNLRYGIVAQPQNLQERQGTITLANAIGADWNPDLLELTTQMDSNEKILERFVEPSSIKMANQVDASILSALNTSVYNVIGTAGAGVGSFQTFSRACALMDQLGLDGPKMGLMNVVDGHNLRSSLSNFFNPTLNREIDIDGKLGELNGCDIYYDQNISSHTNGSFAASGAVTILTTAVSGATTLTLTGFTPLQSNVLLAGDIITVSSVYKVNPVSLNAIGTDSNSLANFIVQAPVNSDGSGHATVTISPTIIFDGSPYVNVSQLPQSGATVTLVGGANGTYTNNFLFVKDAILFASKPYFRPLGVTAGSYSNFVDRETGLAFSVVDWFDGINFKNLKRLDFLYGITIQPAYAVRLIG